MEEEGGDATDMTAVAAESCCPFIKPIIRKIRYINLLFYKMIQI